MKITFKQLNRGVGCIFISFILLLTHPVHGDVIKWNYIDHPVKATENKPSHYALLGYCVESAFDGYGAQGDKPAAVHKWLQTGLPTPDAPYIAEIDYGRPIAVSAFVHYFHVPGNRDGGSTVPGPSAFKSVRISSKNAPGDWTEVAALNDLPTQCPQVLSVNATQSAQLWRIEVLELAPGAESLSSYEIETYQGGIPDIKSWTTPIPDFMGEFTRRITHHKPSCKSIISKFEISSSDDTLSLSAKDKEAAINGTVKLLANGHPCTLRSTQKNQWEASLGSGDILLDAQDTKMGLLLNLTYQASSDNPVKYLRASVQLSTADADLYYIPAYTWTSEKSKAGMMGSTSVPTRMAGLGINDTMLLLVPGTDRGAIGFSDGGAQNDLLIGEKPTPVLISAVRGDWWIAYQFAVKDVYGFTEPTQTVPISKIQNGISNYLMRDDIWEPTLGTLKSWSPDDPHTQLYGFDCFGFYGAPYSIPAYWAKYVMTGDKAALERCKSIVNWLCNSGVRVQDGPAKGAFYNLQRFRGDTPVSVDRQGSTQAGDHILTSQSTGAALWSLLYYRKVTGEKDPKVNRVIDEAAAWLIKTQKPDGGWPYAHNPDGTEYGLDEKSPPPPSSGNIWNIWSLWRLGKETNNLQYLDAVDRARTWFQETYITPHHYHGYWEDVGADSREGYDAAIAAVVFGEMGEKELTVETARDAMQCVFTRQIEPREPSNSAGLVAEQTGWPPASYCNPMMALAAWNAWRITNDDFWRPFARIPKAIGWWYQQQKGAMVWIVDSAYMAPMVGPCFESWWSDWINAQTGSLTLRWLVREVNLRSKGNIDIDEERLSGDALGQKVHLWTPRDGFHPIIPADGQVNWLGLRGDDSVMIAFINDGDKGMLSCPLDSRDVQGASLSPKSVHYFDKDELQTKPWDGDFPVKIKKKSLMVCEWRIKM